MSTPRESEKSMKDFIESRKQLIRSMLNGKPVDLQRAEIAIAEIKAALHDLVDSSNYVELSACANSLANTMSFEKPKKKSQRGTDFEALMDLCSDHLPLPHDQLVHALTMNETVNLKLVNALHSKGTWITGSTENISSGLKKLVKLKHFDAASRLSTKINQDLQGGEELSFSVVDLFAEKPEREIIDFIQNEILKKIKPSRVTARNGLYSHNPTKIIRALHANGNDELTKMVFRCFCPTNFMVKDYCHINIELLNLEIEPHNVATILQQIGVGPHVTFNPANAGLILDIIENAPTVFTSNQLKMQSVKISFSCLSALAHENDNPERPADQRKRITPIIASLIDRQIEWTVDSQLSRDKVISEIKKHNIPDSYLHQSKIYKRMSIERDMAL